MEHYQSVKNDESSQTTTLNDILYSQAHSSQHGQVEFDDHSIQKSRYTTDKEETVKSELKMHEREDGILEIFLDRFTTIFNHEKIHMHEIPQEHAHRFADLVHDG
jgi:hypothetical protein